MCVYIYGYIYAYISIYTQASVSIHAYTFRGSNQQLQEKSHKLMYVIMSNPQSNKGETASARGFCSLKSSSQLCSGKPRRDTAVPMAKLSPTLQPPTPPWCHWAHLSPVAPDPSQPLSWLASPSQIAPGHGAQNIVLQPAA